MKMQKTCSCFGCVKRNIVSEYTSKMKTEDPIVLYIEGMNKLFNVHNSYGMPSRPILNCDYEESMTSTLQLTASLLEHFPGTSIFEYDHCMRMKTEIEKSQDNNFTFQTIYHCYIFHLKKDIPEDERWDLLFKIHNPEREKYESKTAYKKAISRTLDGYIGLNQRVIDLEKENEKLRMLVAHYQNMPGGEEYYATKIHFENITTSIFTMK
jgi:hypothetical protein